MPAQSTNKVILDTSAWLEYYQGTEKGKRVKSFITPFTTVFITGMIASELFSKFLRQGLSIDDVRGNLQMIGALLPFDFELADHTAQVYKKQRGINSKFGIIDAHIAAAGMLNGAKIITCDNDFAGLPNVVIVR